jgi:hypothetical protein
VSTNGPEWLYMVTTHGLSTPNSRVFDSAVLAGIPAASLPNWVADPGAANRALDGGDDYYSFRDKDGHYCQLRRYPAKTTTREAQVK